MTIAPPQLADPSMIVRQGAVDRLRETIRTRPGVSEAERVELYADVDLLAGPPDTHCTVHGRYTHGCGYCSTALLDLARASGRRQPSSVEAVTVTVSS